MSWEFTHYLITRYNVPLAGWEADAKGQATLDDAWHAHRFQLFSHFCFPSVAAQSSKNFTWLVYIMTGMKEDHLRQLQQLFRGQDHFKLIEVDGYDSCMADIQSQFQESETPYILSSRVDNDDALGIDFIRVVQGQFQPIDGVVINLLNGHGYHTRLSVATRLRNIRQNQFMSLIEKRKDGEPLMSIRGFPHDTIPAEFEIVNLPERNSWFKTFHDRNLKSTIFGRPVLSRGWANEYAIARDFVPINVLRTIGYFFYWLADGFKRKVLGMKTRKR